MLCHPINLLKALQQISVYSNALDTYASDIHNRNNDPLSSNHPGNYLIT